MKETKNVLSIDTDYFMGPCIQLYNCCIGRIKDYLRQKYPGEIIDEYSSSRVSEFWEMMSNLLWYDNFLSYDDKKYQDVLDFLKKAVISLSKNSIYFAKEHDAILTFLCGKEENTDCIYNIYNIDHHHDIYYHEKALSNIENFAIADISDWVWYLYNFKKLKNYYWINNPSSKKGTPHEIIHLPEFKNIYLYENIQQLKNIPFDLIFICKSEYHVPDKYHFLFFNIKNEIEELKNIKYDIDNESFCKKRSRFPLVSFPIKI